MAKQERVEGPTPNGGEYAIAYFKGAEGQPVDKEDAVSVEITEFDAEGKSVFRTYADVTSPDDKLKSLPVETNLLSR